MNSITPKFRQVSDSKAFDPLEGPIRAELFSVERLEQHAETLAATQRVVGKTNVGKRHTPRLFENSKVLIAAYRAIVNAARAHQQITPAAEWLLDNFHVVDEQIREIKDDLRRGISARATANNWRALGNCDHLAYHASGEFAALGRDNRRASRRKTGGR